MVTYDENKRNEFSRRLNAALDDAGYPQRARASRIRQQLPFDISINGIKKWLLGESIPATTRLSIIAEIAGVTPRYLLDGDTSEPAPDSDDEQSKLDPIILSFEQAANPSLSISKLNKIPDTERARISKKTLQKLSHNAFAIYMKDESMRSPDIRLHSELGSCQKGDLLIFDQPEGGNVTPGSLVLAVVENTNEVIFRKYKDRGLDADNYHSFELAPLNDDFSPVLATSNNPIKVIGILKVTQRENSAF